MRGENGKLGELNNFNRAIYGISGLVSWKFSLAFQTVSSFSQIGIAQKHSKIYNLKYRLSMNSKTEQE